jgi:hypothetical protein
VTGSELEIELLCPLLEITSGVEVLDGRFHRFTQGVNIVQYCIELFYLVFGLDKLSETRKILEKSQRIITEE